MYKNKMLSLAAAMVLTTTGAMAFDTYKDEGIYAHQDGTDTYKKALYLPGQAAGGVLNKSSNKYGDALIFPKYTSEDGWETEMQITNSLADDAVVAKVVLYAAEDSRELRDFNVYLSAKDVFSFTIKDGSILTSDGSFIKQAADLRKGNDQNTTAADLSSVQVVDHEKETYDILYSDAYTLDEEKGERVGYVIVYGMAQHTDAYHNDHAELFNDYRVLLDNCRQNWAGSMAAGEMYMGTYVDTNISAPSVALTCNDAPSSGYNGSRNVVGFGDVSSDALTGTVRLSKADGTNSRDMILPATALENFTDNAMVLWSEGEYAAIADRNMDSNILGQASYNETAIRNDSNTFNTSSVQYTYNEGSLTNKLVITQPTKRVLVQLGNDDSQWSSVAYGTPAGAEGSVTTSYGAFTTSSRTYNENEGSYTPSGGSGPIISPATTNPEDPDSYSSEVQVITDLEDIGRDPSDTTTANSGFTDMATAVPAVITQMVGSVEVDGDAQVNWIYAPVK